MKKNLLSFFIALASLPFLASDAMADTPCNWGNYSMENTTYLSPQAGDNNQIQINEAINAAPEGGSVYLRSGTYVISRPIKLKSKLILEGDKDAVIQLKDHANWRTIAYLGENNGSVKDPLIGGDSGLSDVEIKCFKIDGNYNFRSNSGGGNASTAFRDCIGASATSWDDDMRKCEEQYLDRWHGNGYYTLIGLSNGGNWAIHDMTLQDGANDGVKVDHASGVRFYNNFVNAMGHEGFYALYSHGMEVYDNKIAIRASDGVRGDDSYDFSIHDNEFYSYNRKDSSAGVQIAYKGRKDVYNIQIFRNEFHDIWSSGVWLPLSIPSHNGKAAVEIHHNIFQYNGLSTNPAVGATGGVVSNGANSAVVFNNTFYFNYGNGVYDSGDQLRVINNIFSNTQEGNYSAAGQGIAVSGAGEVSYNDFYQNVGGDYTTGGEGNYNGDPLFNIPGEDFHIRSKAGRWDPAAGAWVADVENSPAIDAAIEGGEYGAYDNEPWNNGERLNMGRYGNTSEASLTGEVPQVPMPPAPTPRADQYPTVRFTTGRSEASIGASIGADPWGGATDAATGGSTYTGGTSTEAGVKITPGSYTENDDAWIVTIEDGTPEAGVFYFDPKAAVLGVVSSPDPQSTAALKATSQVAPIFPELAPAADTATAECSVSQEKGGLIPCGRNTDDPSTSWNECRKCDLCSIVLMLQLTIEFLLKMAGIVATLAIVAAGSLYMLAAGKAEHINRAKDMVKYTLIGFAVVFTAWIVVNSVLAILGYIDPLGGDWYTVC
jgi:hypothetical protein